MNNQRPRPADNRRQLENSSGNGQGKDKPGAAQIAAGDRNPLAMGRQNGSANVKAQTGAFGGPGLVHFIKAVENLHKLTFRNARTAILDNDFNFFRAAGTSRCQRNNPLVRGKSDCIGQNIVDDPVDQPGN